MFYFTVMEKEKKSNGREREEIMGKEKQKRRRKKEIGEVGKWVGKDRQMNYCGYWKVSQPQHH